MDILVKTKFNKGDKVVVKIINDAEKLPVFVLAEVCDVKRIIKINSDFNKIAYNIKTYKIDKCLSQFQLAEEDQMYSFEEFKKMFDALQIV